MSCSSSPIDITDPLVLDTSVLINLHACKYGERILAAIPNDILVPEIVVGELEHETSRRNGEHGFLYSLVANGTVTLAGLTEAEYKIFYELTSIAPSLDDGEAATIAVAAARNFLPVIDEKGDELAPSPKRERRAGHWISSVIQPRLPPSAINPPSTRSISPFATAACEFPRKARIA